MVKISTTMKNNEIALVWTHALRKKVATWPLKVEKLANENEYCNVNGSLNTKLIHFFEVNMPYVTKA